MMKLLAVDTSTGAGSLAFLQGEKVMAEWTMQSAMTHNRRLLKSIDSFLNDLGWSIRDIDAFAATLGPGSFTGLRIGLATVKTLAWSLNKLFAGIPSLDALAAPFAYASLPVCTLIDARRKEVYCSTYEPDGRGSLRRLTPCLAISPDRVAELITTPTLFCGDGWLLYGELLKEMLGDRLIEAPAPYHVLRASFVAELARQKILAGKADDPVGCVPLYVRPSEAELRNPHLSSLADLQNEGRAS